MDPMGDDRNPHNGILKIPTELDLPFVHLCFRNHSKKNNSCHDNYLDVTDRKLGSKIRISGFLVITLIYTIFLT